MLTAPAKAVAHEKQHMQNYKNKSIREGFHECRNLSNTKLHPKPKVPSPRKYQKYSVSIQKQYHKFIILLSVSRVEYGKKLNSAVPDLLLLLLLWLLVITIPGSRIASIVYARVLGNLCVPIAIGGRCISIVAAATIPLAWIYLRLKTPS